jgi:predicted nucleic acid-binding protein
LILVDTSIWIDHLRQRLSALERLLDLGEVLGHPWVVGEIALGHLSNRDEILGLLSNLPQATVATAPEVLAVIDRHRLHGRGIGYVDAQLLAAALLTPTAGLWTSDRRLSAAASGLGLTPWTRPG